MISSVTSSERPAAADIEFDPFSPTYFDDPYETYRQLRDDRPVYLNEHVRLRRPVAVGRRGRGAQELARRSAAPTASI